MIVLTGGAGFVGSNLLRALNDKGEDDILVVDHIEGTHKQENLDGTRYRDYINKDQFIQHLGKTFSGEDVRAIFHQGACTDTLESDRSYMLSNNLEYSKILLQFAIDHAIPFVYASSASVYGDREIGIEKDRLGTPLNIYAQSKLLFDEYVQQIKSKASSTIVGLRYFNVYGPGETQKGRMSSMVHQLYEQIQQTGTGKLFGAAGGFDAGEQLRDFVFVRDIVYLNLFFMDRDPVQEIFNAGTGQGRTWNELGRAVIKELGKGQIEYTDFPPSLIGKYQFNLRADLTKLREFGYERKFLTLEEGVHEFALTRQTTGKPSETRH